MTDISELINPDSSSNTDIDKELLAVFKEYFTDSNLYHKTEIPKKEFHKLLKLKIYGNEVKKFSPQTFKFIVRYLKEYMTMVISVDRKSRSEFFEALKTFKGNFQEKEMENTVKHRFLR